MQEKAAKTKELLPRGSKKDSDQFVQFTTVQMNFVMTGELISLR